MSEEKKDWRGKAQKPSDVAQRQPDATQTPPTHDSTATRPAPESFPSHADPPMAADPPEETPAPVRTLDEKLGIGVDKKTEADEGDGPQDIEGVKTVKQEDLEDAPPRIRVWEGQHSAEAAIIKNNDDDTFDLSADIWGTGQPIDLIGVKRRVGGQGNGWELIDMAAEAKAKAQTPHDEREGTGAPKISLAMIRLTITPPFNGELVIGHTTYQVTGGVVEVAPWDADAARKAGYQG